MYVMLRCAGDKVRSVCLCLFVCAGGPSAITPCKHDQHSASQPVCSISFSLQCLSTTNNKHSESAFFPLYVMTIQFVIPFTVSKLCSVCIYEQECIPVGCIPSATVAVSWGCTWSQGVCLVRGVPARGVYLVGAVYLPGGCTWSQGGTCPGG